jgi:flagellar biosynthesis/type III secretory pathway M-ring protein FliF/YscJ
MSNTPQTEENQKRLEYLQSIEEKMQNNFEANFHEIFGLLKQYIAKEKAEINTTKPDQEI